MDEGLGAGGGAPVNENGLPPSTKGAGRAEHREQVGQGESTCPFLLHGVSSCHHECIPAESRVLQC